MCICVGLYVEPVSRSKDYIRSGIKIGSVVCPYTPVSPKVSEIEAINNTFFSEDSGLCCRVLCLSSGIISLCLLLLSKRKPKVFKTKW